MKTKLDLLARGIEPRHWTYKDHMRTDTLCEHGVGHITASHTIYYM